MTFSNVFTPTARRQHRIALRLSAGLNCLSLTALALAQASAPSVRSGHVLAFDNR